MAPMIYPQVLGALMAQQGGQPAGAPPPGAVPPPGAIPPTSPVQPQQGTGGIDTSGLTNLSAQQLGQMNQLPSTAEETAARAAAVQKAQEAQQMPLPKTGPQIEKGRSVGHNLGQAALMVGGMTGLGRNLNQEIYGPGQKAYAMQQAGLAGEEKAYEEQAKGAQEETQTMGQVAGRGLYAGAKVESANISATSRYRGLLQQIASAGNLADKKNATNMAIAKIKADQAQKDAEIAATAHIEGIQDQTAVMAQIAANHNQTLADLQAAGFAQDPSLLGDIKRAIGIEPVGAAGAQAPQQQPVRQVPTAAGAGAGNAPHKPAARGTGPPKGATHIAPGSDGRNHYTNSQGQDLGVAP